VKKAVVILSGGMDSTVAGFIAKNEGYEIIALHFNYSQRTQKKEEKAFFEIAKSLKAEEIYNIDLPFFSQIGATALIDTSLEVPTDGIKPGVPITYVPFRNGIFLSIAAAIAEKENAQSIFLGVVEEDSSGYPDCRESFIKAMEKAINLGTKPQTKITIKTPLIHLKKGEIVKLGAKLNVPFEKTWSCYKDSTLACGVCDSCRLRLKGFKEAGIVDPIPYSRFL